MENPFHIECIVRSIAKTDYDGSSTCSYPTKVDEPPAAKRDTVIRFLSKKVKTLETSTYGSEPRACCCLLFAVRVVYKIIMDLWYQLYIVHVGGPTGWR